MTFLRALTKRVAPRLNVSRACEAPLHRRWLLRIEARHLTSTGLHRPSISPAAQDVIGVGRVDGATDSSSHPELASKGLPEGLPSELIKHSLREILAALPAEWRGTTFNNSNLLGRQGFGKKLEDLILHKIAAGKKISKRDLLEVGYAEDYLRVASNISTLLELVLAREKGLDITQVFSFASEVLPIFSLCIASKRPVKFYVGSRGKAPFTSKHRPLLRKFGINLECYPSCRVQPARADELVVCHEDAVLQTCPPDAIIAPGMLYITNPQKIDPDEILLIRKRMSTPMTSPAAEGMLQELAGNNVTANIYGPGPTSPVSMRFYKHLQSLCGTPVDESAKPVLSTVGLSVLSSLWLTLIARGGADVLMCSTAYGGSCQLAEIFDGFDAKFRKHEFHIQGGASIVPSIQAQLTELRNGAALLPTTVIFLEIPTNPDMKVPDVPALVAMIQEYKIASGREVLLLLDTTFAPGSGVMQKVRDLAEDLCCMVFISLSKSVSRGLTTGGTLIANHIPEAKEILHGVADACQMLDLTARPDQMMHLVEHHARVEERCQQAYKVAAAVGEALREAVHLTTGHDMPLAFVTSEQAAMGFTTSTFSFNLPALPGASAEENEALAQRFVDLLCAHPSRFKPCVSFGQDNGLVYCTVPATSTQGAVKAEDKEKQAVGGVQLVRLSFPPTTDIQKVSGILTDSVSLLYQPIRCKRVIPDLA